MDKAYKNLAKYYDYLQKEMDYEKWVNWILNEAPDRNISILEVGCGTGFLATRLYDLDYKNIDAFDLSEEMIYHANMREYNINFFVDNIATFKTEKKYDLIICFMDTFNYIIDDKDIKSSLKNMHAALSDNGVLIMDIHQSDNLENFDGYLETGFTDTDVEYVWYSHVVDYDKRIINHDFRFIEKNGEEKERHTQRIMPLEFYQKLFAKVFNDFSVTMDDYRFYLTLKK
ncbi:MAG: class I SAM-dependent DNA methyltransferase [Mycoplasmatales bacterium]